MDENTQPLNQHDIQAIVRFIVEDSGTRLDKPSFTESFMMMLEDVPGCEFINPSQTEVADTAYLLYQQMITEKKV